MNLIKNFKTDKNALTLPWTESPFFYDLLESSNLNEGKFAKKWRDEESNIKTYKK
jgi:hypothetical protein